MVAFPTGKPDTEECGLYLQASERLKTKPRITYLDSQSNNTDHYRILSHELSVENW